MAWFKKPKYTIVRTGKKNDIPAGMFNKCEKCDEVLTQKELEDNLKVCPKCGHHTPMTAQERIELLIDEGSFQELEGFCRTSDPLQFHQYMDKLERAREKNRIA